VVLVLCGGMTDIVFGDLGISDARLCV
jgi:hypothetical protein